VTGSAGEAELVRRVIGLMEEPGRALDAAGRVSVLGLAALVQRSSLVVANDTAPVHIGSSLGVPVFAFYGPNTPRLYGPLAGGLVDADHRFLEGNDRLSGISVLWRAFTDPAAQTADGTEAGLWRPLRTLSFSLDRAVFGAAAWGPHLVNVLLHGAATALVFAFLRRVGASVVAALLGALLYALHPAQLESV